MTDADFADLGLSDDTLDALEDLGFEAPTPVQAGAIPSLVAGRDALVEAPTGTGKTAAFAVGLVERQPPDVPLNSLVVAPTRELAAQVADVISAVGRPHGYRAVAVTGGANEEAQLARLADAACVVATPGRLLHLLEEDDITLVRTRIVVVDEVDRLLDEGFRPDLERILDLARDREQTVFVSATVPEGVRELSDAHLTDPEEVRVDAAPTAVTHHRVNVKDAEKPAAVAALLEAELKDRALVFANTKARVDELVRVLRALGYSTDPLHGDRTAFQRRHVTDLFRKGASRVLVATDVAARGLDVPDLDLVINADAPDDANEYRHRAGRTGRMGRAGRVITLVAPHEKRLREAAERAADVTMTPYRLEVDAAAVNRTVREAEARKRAKSAKHGRGKPPGKGRRRTR